MKYITQVCVVYCIFYICYVGIVLWPVWSLAHWHTKNPAAPLWCWRTSDDVHYQGIICLMYTAHSRECTVLRCFSHFRELWTFPLRWEGGHRMLTIWMVCDGNELPSCSHDTGYLHTGPDDCPLRHFIDPAVTDLNPLHWYWDDFCQNRGQRLVISLSFSIEAWT